MRRKRAAFTKSRRRETDEERPLRREGIFKGWWVIFRITDIGKQSVRYNYKY